MRKIFAMLLVLTGCGAPGVMVDAGSLLDAGATSVTEIHGCTGAMYVDRSADSASRTISFGTANGSPALGYDPKCITIAKGQTVTFTGNFNTHPLMGGAYNSDAGTHPNPIPRTDTGSNDLPVTFSEAGLYPYYCDYHAPTMVGVVQVR